jgi:hypothetical protein
MWHKAGLPSSISHRRIFLKGKGKANAKFTLKQATKAQRRSRDIAILFL